MVLLFPVLLLTISSPFLIKWGFGQSNSNLFFDEDSALKWKAELENSISVKKPTKKQSVSFTKNLMQNHVVNKKFNFNPNKVTKEEIIELGFSQRVANNWDRFRNAGAKFYEYNDLKKIYGIDSVLLSSLKKYIQYDPKPDETSFPSKEKTDKPKIYEVVFKELDLNKTDSEDLKKISGIGEKLSERIIKYRNQLGGFHSSDQLHEVYGLDSAVIDRINRNFHLQDTVKLITINQIGEKELKDHPYFRGKRASIIINYRMQHGNFSSPEDLKKIHILNDSIVSKMAPYLRFE